MKHVLGIVIAVALTSTACGKDEKTKGGESGGVGSPETGGGGGAGGGGTKAKPIDKARAEALTKLDVPGFARTRGEARGSTAVLVYLGAPNAGGYAPQLLVNVGPCEFCGMKMTRENYDQMVSASDTANPALVFESGDIDLGGGLTGSYAYWESWTKDGPSTSALHKMWMTANDKVNTLTFDISPQHADGFKMPASLDELKAEMTKDEMLAAAKTVAATVGKF